MVSKRWERQRERGEANRLEEEVSTVQLADDAANAPDVRGVRPTQLEGHLRAAVLSRVDNGALVFVIKGRSTEVDHWVRSSPESSRGDRRRWLRVGRWCTFDARGGGQEGPIGLSDTRRLKENVLHFQIWDETRQRGRERWLRGWAREKEEEDPCGWGESIGGSPTLPGVVCEAGREGRGEREEDEREIDPGEGDLEMSRMRPMG
jgi:hypothetical protein